MQTSDEFGIFDYVLQILKNKFLLSQIFYIEVNIICETIPLERTAQQFFCLNNSSTPYFIIQKVVLFLNKNFIGHKFRVVYLPDLGCHHFCVS